MNHCKVIFLTAILVLGLFVVIIPARAQTAEQVLRENPTIPGLAAYVLNWETNINRRNWNEMMYGDFLKSSESQGAVLFYKNRAGQYVDRETFIEEVRRRNEMNLP